jgi:NitT/TauT family transport system substrate-binding protein
VVQQAFPTSEPYQAAQKGMKYRFFPIAAEGYPPYHGALVTLQKTIDAKPDMVARFVRATAEGWKSFLPDPAPAAALIKRENPNMTDGEIAFAVQKLKDSQAVTGGDAAQLGIGAMTEARWKKNYDFMVESGLLSPSTEWRKAYTTRFIDDLKVMP